jgi:Do/DeqQ family serine protease
MDSTDRRTLPRARWLLPGTIAGTVVALSIPALLHAQSAPVTVTPQPATTATTTAPAQSAPPVATPALADATQLGTAFSTVAQRVLPSVVSIRVEAEADPDSAQGMIPFMMPFGGDGEPSPQIVHGEGSGVIVRPDGVILTNNHVVERARRLAVHLHDGRVFRGRVLGTDPATDLALVRIDATGLPAAPLGDSDRARVGEWVLAVGAPLGLEATVTHGVVSATGRAGLGANEIEDYLQTDASINPGNSGGPLVNLRGEVLGINTMIVGRNTGIGMAVPSRLAQTVIDQILRTGHVSRGWIGVGVQDLSDDLAQGMGLSNGMRGALVNQIEPNTPAARGGLVLGDVVTSIDGQPVAASMDLVRLITRRSAGERVALTVMREGHARNLAVVTAPRPGPEQPQVQNVMNVAPPANHQLGLRLATLSPELAARMGAPPDGVVIASVAPGSAADDAGLRRGDLILRADGRAVHAPADVVTATQDGHATLLVRRGRGQMFVPLSVD